MPFLTDTFHRIKSRLADRLGLRRLFAATSYLLVRQINVDAPPEGPHGNRRLHEAFLGLFAVVQPDLFLEIGAKDGSASIAVREMAPACAVHAFEANPRVHANNLERLAQCGIRYWNLAVGDRVGGTVVYAPRVVSRAYADGDVGPASVAEPETTGKTSLLLDDEDATYDEFEVETTTLDAFASAHVPDWRARTVFLWVDAEGASERVLAGAERLLSRTRVIFIETEGFKFWRGEADCGTVASRLLRAGFLPIARDSEHGDRRFNVLFVHQDLVDRILPQLFDSSAPVRMYSDSARHGGTPPFGAEPAELPRPFLSVGSALQADIPVFVPCFNTVTYVRGMVAQLQALGLRRLFLVDNASTYPPMRAFLAAPPPGVTVIALPENKGPRGIFCDPASYAMLPQFFCITDPDLLLNPKMPGDFIAQLASLTEQHAIGKAGLAIDIADRADMRQDEFLIHDRRWKIWEWEERFWQEPLEPLPGGDPVFRAIVDTTFAVYNKRFFDADPRNSEKAVRVAGRYTCRHLPWYTDVGLPIEEEQFYRSRTQYSFFLRD
jgi:FkbM family methyltransferase